jgi:hypothetical protein
MEPRKRELVNGLDVKGEEIELAVIRPTQKILDAAQLRYNLKVASLIREGNNGGERLLLKSELEDHLDRLGLWTQRDRMKYTRIHEQLQGYDRALKEGGIKLSEARMMAIKMSELRTELMVMHAKRSQLDNTTIEATADNHRFNFLVTQCVLDAQTGLPYMLDLDVWAEKCEEPVVREASAKLAEMLYGIDPNFVDNLPENQWLRKYGFVNADGRLTDRQGRLVDRDGKLVNEKGQWIDDQGNPINANGERTDDDGNVLIEAKPFIDDETGQAIVDNPGDGETKPEPRKRKARKGTGE